MAGCAEAVAGRISVCRLPHGGDLLQSIREAAEKLDVEAAVFWIIGAVKRARVSFYDQERKTYRQMELGGPMEILSCTGNVGKLKGGTVVHAHAVFGEAEGRAYGGHVEKGTEIFSAEMFMVEVKGIRLEREFDETTGLNLFKL